MKSYCQFKDVLCTCTTFPSTRHFKSKNTTSKTKQIKGGPGYKDIYDSIIIINTWYNMRQSLGIFQIFGDSAKRERERERQHKTKNPTSTMIHAEQMLNYAVLRIYNLMASIVQPGGEATTFTLPGFLANQAFRAALGAEKQMKHDVKSWSMLVPTVGRSTWLHHYFHDIDDLLWSIQVTTLFLVGPVGRQNPF